MQSHAVVQVAPTTPPSMELPTPPSPLLPTPAATPDTLLRPGFSLDQLERDVIHHALTRARGNKTEAARLLGITRRRLYSRLESIDDAAADAPDDPAGA